MREKFVANKKRQEEGFASMKKSLELQKDQLLKQVLNRDVSKSTN